MRQGVLKAAIDHRPRAEDFAVIETARPACPEDGVVLKLSHVSLDPYVGTRLRGRHMGEAPPRPMTDPVPGHGVGQVVETRSAAFKEGDWAHTENGGWREYAAMPAAKARRFDPARLAPSVFLGALGMPGLTAWAGVTDRAKIAPGETFTVDAAAGAVGGAAGQIARLKGAARVVGIAGGPEKCALVERDYGFDACIDHRREDWRDAFTNAVQPGLDVHFENVGGDLLALALQNMRLYGRAVLCGLAAHYHADAAPASVALGPVVGRRAALLGLVVYDYYDRWSAFLDEAAPWAREGRLRIAEDVAEGLDAAPAQFQRLMEGCNTGKALVRIA